MAAAIDLFRVHESIEVEAVSGLYATPPWGKIDQPEFLNAAIRIDTSLQPHELLEAILAVERRLGRERTERWGPRTIDIDILLFGNEAIEEPGLRIPHLRLSERAFALAPLVDVLPDAYFAGRTAAEWLSLSDTSGMTRLAGPDWYKPAGNGSASLSRT
jgi:2-amino-4-hydroxy-6-hydroxymethyldihydropteridine diphosphokinase